MIRVCSYFSRTIFTIFDNYFITYERFVTNGKYLTFIVIREEKCTIMSLINENLQKQLIYY